MTHIGEFLLSRARALLQREDGNATIEFVIMLPIVFTLFLAAIELGLMMIHQVMLERSVDLTIRDLRLGKFVEPTQDDIRLALCNRSAAVNDCMNNILIEMRPVNTSSWNMLGSNATCRNKSIPIDPAGADGKILPGISHQLILVRVCAVIEPYFPSTFLGMHLYNTDIGGYALVASSAFVNEPPS